MVARTASKKRAISTGKISVRFGAGLHTRASEEDISQFECADGVNFDLDPLNMEFRPRRGITLLGQAPNREEIRGFASFISADNTIFFGVQAGGEFYSIDPTGTFTKVGNVNQASRMRGHWRDHYWSLDDKILIPDIELQQGVYEWDGSNLNLVSFRDSDSGEFGFFSAKYLKVNRERAFFANVRDASGILSHFVVASEAENYDKISVSDKPSSAIGEADPFYFVSGDLREINGVAVAWKRLFFSTKNGSMWQMYGDNSQEFGLEPFYEGSNASGVESMVWAGNDVYYGKIGTVESLAGVAQFGDLEATAISNPIKPEIENVTRWTSVYNDRTQRAYFFPEGRSDLFVLHKSMLNSDVSPWSKWQTKLPVAFQP